MKEIGCFVFVIGIIIVTVIIYSIVLGIDKKQKDNDNFNEASSLLQEFKYEQALEKLGSISSGYKKYDSVQILKQIANDSLNEKNYKSGKEFFDKNDYQKALPLLKKVNDRHKEYNEVKDMIIFSNEMIKAKVNLSLATYIKSKNNGVSGKEFQQKLNDKKDNIAVLLEVVTQFSIVATQIKTCENVQNFEFKYLEDSKINNLKAECKKLATQARSKLNKEQLRDFPLLRKEYAKIPPIVFKDRSIGVKTKGSKNTILEFTCIDFYYEGFADSFLKNLNESKLIQNQILPMRFKRLEFNSPYSSKNYYSVDYDTPADDVEVNKRTYSCRNCKK